MNFSTKLSALFLMILLAGMSAIGYLGYRATTGMLENDIREQLEGNAFHTMDKIDRIFFERYADMHMLAADPVVRSRRSTPGQVTERLQAFQGRSGQYASLGFFDLKRVRLADTSGNNIGVRHPYAEYWPDIAAGREFVMTIAESQTLKKVVIYFATVVKDAKGIPFGVVAARMPVESLYEIAEQTLHKRKDRETIKVELWNRDGLLLYSSYDADRMLKGTSRDWEDLRETLSQDKAIGSVRHGYAGEDEISAFAREQGYREFKGNGWLLVICTPVKAAFAPARELGGRLLVIYVSIGCALVLAVFIVSRRVVRPLKVVSRAAAEIGKGNLDIQVEVGSQDEVGRLALAFNKMASDLKESEVKYKNLAELLPQVVYEIDEKGSVVFANHYGLKLFGYTQDDLKNGLNAMQLFIPEDRDRVAENMRKGLRGEQIENVEYTAITKDEIRFPMLTYASPIIHEKKSVGIRGIGIDITERKRAEEALKASAGFSRTVMDSMSDGIYVVDVSDYRITGCNAAFLKKLGLGMEDVVGKHCYEVSHRRRERCHSPNDACPLEETAATGTLAAAEHVHFTEDGRKYYVEVTTTPVFNENGKVVQVVHVDRDITERKLAENALRESEDRYRSVVDNVGIGIALISPKMEILSLNRQMKEWSPAIDVSQRPICFQSFNRPPRKEICTYCPTAKTLKDGQVHVSVTETPTEGGIVNYRVTSSPLRDSEGNVIAAIELVEDITERKRSEDEIRKLNQELEIRVEKRTKQLLDAQEELVRKEKLATLGQLAGTVGHELRNPLGVMNNAVYFLQTVHAGADETTKEYLGIIKSEIASADRIVSDLLDAVRTKPPHPQLVLAEDLIRMSMEKCRIPERVRVEVMSATQLSVLIDPLQMKQVFINLISNGVDAMPEGGALKITAEEDMNVELVRFSFRDEGAGIAPENMAKLFQPLFTTKTRGIGLGLIVVKNLTEANGGSVEVKSTPGKGATFTVTLPAEDRPAVEQARDARS